MEKCIRFEQSKTEPIEMEVSGETVWVYCQAFADIFNAVTFNQSCMVYS